MDCATHSWGPEHNTQHSAGQVKCQMSSNSVSLKAEKAKIAYEASASRLYVCRYVTRISFAYRS